MLDSIFFVLFLNFLFIISIIFSYPNVIIIIKEVFFNEEVITALEKTKIPRAKLETIRDTNRTSASPRELQLVSARIRKYTEGYQNSKGTQAPMGPIIKGLLTSPDYRFKDYKAMMINGYQKNHSLWDEILRIDLYDILKNISKTYEGVKVLDNVSFTVKQDDKIAFLADNEIAKTVLFQIISGELEPDSGELVWGTTITNTYFPKDNNYLFESEENITEWLRKYSKDPDETYVRGFLGRMLFSGDEALKQVNVLSGGEKVRCVLSKMMLSGANFLIFDEPTNHLDMESITSVNNGMTNFKGNILFTSHDHQLTQTVANRVIDIKQDGKIIDREVTYNEYLGIE